MSEVIQNETVETIEDGSTHSNCNIDEVSTTNEVSEQNKYQDKPPPSSESNVNEETLEEVEQNNCQDNPSSSGLDVDKDALDDSFVELDCREMPSSSGQHIDEHFFDEVGESDEFVEVPSSSGLNMDIRQELGTEFTIAEYLEMCYDGTYQGFEQAILKIAQAYARSTDAELDSLLESTEHLLRLTEEEYIILITDKMHTVFQNCQKKGLDQLKSANERLVSLIVNNTSVSPKTHNAVICCLNALFEDQLLTNEALQDVILPCLLDFLHGRPHYQLNFAPDYYYIKNRPTVGQIVVRCADLLDTQTVDEDVVPVFEELICDDSDIHFTMLQNMALVFRGASIEKRTYLLTKLNSFLRIESSKGWRLREEFAYQCLMMCSSCSLAQINQYIICFALSFMDDRFDCVRQKAILLLSEILSTFISCEWPTLSDVDTDNLDALLRQMPLSKATIHDIYGSFAHSTLWRRRQAFATLLIHVLQNEKSKIEQFGRLFGNDLVGIAKDKLPNIRLKFLSIWRFVHSDEKNANSFDELFPELYVNLKEALEDMAAGDSDFEVQTQARIALNLIQPQKDPLDYGDHYRRLTERENKLWERLDEYKEEYDRRMMKLNDSNSSESTAGYIESYAQEERPRTSSVKAIASNIQALFNNRRSPQTQKTPKRGRGGFKFVVSSVPESERSPPTYKSSDRSPEAERRQMNMNNDYSIDAHFVIPSIIEDEQGSSTPNQSIPEEEKSPLLSEPALNYCSEVEERQTNPELSSEFAEPKNSLVTDDDVIQLADEENERSLDALISEIEKYSSTSEPSLKHSPDIEGGHTNPELPEESASAVDDILFEIVDEVEKSLDAPVSSIPENNQSSVHESSLDHSSESEQKQESPELPEPESTSITDDILVESSDVSLEESPALDDKKYLDSDLPLEIEQGQKDPEVTEQEKVLSTVNTLESTLEENKSIDVSVSISEHESSPLTLKHSSEVEQQQLNPEAGESNKTPSDSSFPENGESLLTDESSSSHIPEIENEQKNHELTELESATVSESVAFKSTDEERDTAVDSFAVPVSEDDHRSSLNHSPEAEQKQKSSELVESKNSSLPDVAPKPDEGNNESSDARSAPINSDLLS